MVKKMFYVRSLRKKCFLLIRSEKICTFKLGVEKTLIMKKNHSPSPRIKWSAPKTYIRINSSMPKEDHHEHVRSLGITKSLLQDRSSPVLITPQNTRSIIISFLYINHIISTATSINVTLSFNKNCFSCFHILISC